MTDMPEKIASDPAAARLWYPPALRGRAVAAACRHVPMVGAAMTRVVACATSASTGPILGRLIGKWAAKLSDKSLDE